MTEKEPSSDNVFDISRIRELVELMKTNELNEIDLRHGEQRIRMRRGDEYPTTAYAAPPQMAMAPVAPPAAPTPAADAPASTATDEAHIALIKSPMVGTFYARPNPKAEPFVKVGDHVNPETTVCTVEAMKMFNEIPAGVSGKIVAVLIDNEEPVDVNKPLFKVDTRQ